ncbi:RloB family protein [Brevibacterium sediminis]|uniref:RloB family protein n=1 Tax=Brevibacterium sediminis TaxID=1857024 RepID=UPI0035BE65B7|nr:RloB family protein [Brevibacterium sediminis]
MTKPSERPRKSRFRSSASKARKRKFIVLVEGETTETAYLDFVQSTVANQNIEISVLTPGSARSTLFSHARSELETLANEGRKLLKSEGRKDKAEDLSQALLSNEVGEVWIVCDVDDEAESIKQLRPVPEHQRTHDDLDEAVPYVRWAVSNPCFEVWLIWHFEDYSNPGVRSIAQKICKDRRILSGANGKVLDRSRLTPENTELAISRAKHMRKRHSEISTFPNDVPSSDMDLLVEALQRLESLKK